MANIPYAVEHRAPTLISRRVGVLPFHVRSQLERNRPALSIAVRTLDRLTGWALRILDGAERVVACELPPFAEALVERHDERMPVRPSLHVLTVDESPLGINARGNVAEGDVVAGHRVVRQVL